MFRVCWKTNNNTGNGEYCMTQDIAKSWIDEMNKKYNGEIIHWMEEKQK
jgi:hypothetical protein